MDNLEIWRYDKILNNPRFNTIEKIILLKKIQLRLEKKLEIIKKRDDYKIGKIKFLKNSTYMRYKK